MPFVACAPLAFAGVACGTAAALTLRAARHAPDDRASVRDGGLGLAAMAAGAMLLLVAPDGPTSPLGAIGLAAVLFGSGLLWASARRRSGALPPRPTAISAGAIGWLALASAASPSLGWSVALASAVLAAYGAATVRERLRSGVPARAAEQRQVTALAAHAALWAGWTVLAPALGFVLSAENVALATAWLLGLDLALVATVCAWPGRAETRAGIPAPPRPPEPALDDELTGIGNGKALLDSGTALLAETLASGRPLALLMMDLDGFATLNRRHGAAAADRLLKSFARLAHDYLPPASLVCRVAGDTFAALVPGADATRARAVADDLRSLFAHLNLDEDGALVRATASIGVAQARPGQASLPDLVGAAARCLLAAKNGGRDRVVHEADG